jgi:hypothetical protein
MDCNPFLRDVLADDISQRCAQWLPPVWPRTGRA